MPDILALLQCLRPLRRGHQCASTQPDYHGHAGNDRESDHALAFPVGRVGDRYRTVQRFFHTALPWATLLWVFFRQHLFCPQEVYLLAGDEVVVTKAGKKTYGIERFFSSLYGQSVSGLSFFTLSLVSIQQRRSFPIRLEQIIKSAEEQLQKTAENSHPIKNYGQAKRTKGSPKKNKTSQNSPQGTPKKRGGRPKGSKTKSKTAVTLSPELLRIQGWIQAFLKQVSGFLPVNYLLLDGHFGNNKALQMARQLNLHLISCIAV